MALVTEEDQQDFNSMSAAFVEALYADYLNDPNSVSHDWQRFFAQIAPHEWPQPQIGPSFPTFSVFNPPSDANGNGTTNGNGAYTNGHAGDQARHRHGRAARSRRPVGPRLPRARPHGRARSIRSACRGRRSRNSSRSTTASPTSTSDMSALDPHDQGSEEADAARDRRLHAQHLLPPDRRAVHAHRQLPRPPVAARPDGRDREPAGDAAAKNNSAFSRSSPTP